MTDPRELPPRIPCGRGFGNRYLLPGLMAVVACKSVGN